MNRLRIIILGLAFLICVSILYTFIRRIPAGNPGVVSPEWHNKPSAVETIKPGDTCVITNSTDSLYIEVYNKSDYIK